MSNVSAMIEIILEKKMLDEIKIKLIRIKLILNESSRPKNEAII
jgi:hypothetical protein